MKLIPYHDQIEFIAKSAKVDLATACRHAGIADTTSWRWRRTGSEMSLDTASRILAAIRDLAERKRPPSAAGARGSR